MHTFSQTGGNRESGFAERVALVTGATVGIGAAIAKMLAREGAMVALVARRADRLVQVQREIEASGGRAMAIPADLLDDAALHSTIETTERAYGPVDILVNNAGIVHVGPIFDITPEQWDEVIRLNLRAPFLLARAVLPGMRSRKRGWIVNISSQAGLAAIPRMGPYTVSKNALNVLTELLVAENQDHGIQAISICPGWVVTDMTAGVELDHEKALRPEDVAETVRWAIAQPPHVRIGPTTLVRPMEYAFRHADANPFPLIR